MGPPDRSSSLSTTHMPVNSSGSSSSDSNQCTSAQSYHVILSGVLLTTFISGPSLLEHLDTMPMVDRKVNAPLMMPVSEKYKDMGTIIVGKIESGHLRKGDSLLLMPNKDIIEVAGIYNEMEEEVQTAICGDNVRIRVRGVEDDDISPGFVLTSPSKPVHAVRQFEAQLAILDHKNIICAGYSAVMHIHTLAEEVTLSVCRSLFTTLGAC